MLFGLIKTASEKEYDESLVAAVEQLLPMDILVTRTRSPISYFIRMKTNSDWSHVCLAGEDGTIFTTTATGYALVRAEKYLKGKSFAVYRHEQIDDIRRDYGLHKNRKLLEADYAYGDLLKMIGANYLGREVKEVKNADDKKYFCAEIVSETYWDMHLPLLPHLGLKFTGFTPQRCVEDSRLHEVARVEK